MFSIFHSYFIIGHCRAHYNKNRNGLSISEKKNKNNNYWNAYIHIYIPIDVYFFFTRVYFLNNINTFICDGTQCFILDLKKNDI